MLKLSGVGGGHSEAGGLEGGGGGGGGEVGEGGALHLLHAVVTMAVMLHLDSTTTVVTTAWMGRAANAHMQSTQQVLCRGCCLLEGGQT